MAEPALHVQKLSVGREGRTIIGGLSFEAHAGSMIAIVGPNGAGKSTLLKAVAGLLPYRGTIAVDGIDASTLPPRTRATRIAYVPQHSALDAAVCVRDVVAQGRFAHLDFPQRHGAADATAIDRAMARTRTSEMAGRAFNVLSYGERRRVLMARALATQARILLLDEPSGALDVGHALSLFALLRELASEGCCIVIVLHQLQEAARFADRALLLAQGSAVVYGRTEDVITADPIRRVYGVDIVPGAHFGYAAPPGEPKNQPP